MIIRPGTPSIVAFFIRRKTTCLRSTTGAWVFSYRANESSVEPRAGSRYATVYWYSSLRNWSTYFRCLERSTSQPLGWATRDLNIFDCVIDQTSFGFAVVTAPVSAKAQASEALAAVSRPAFGQVHPAFTTSCRGD